MNSEKLDDIFNYGFLTFLTLCYFVSLMYFTFFCSTGWAFAGLFYYQVIGYKKSERNVKKSLKKLSEEVKEIM